MCKEIRLQLCAGYIFIYVTVNMMTFAVAISQQYYNFTDSRSENAGVKELKTEHVPYASV
jgi:hypothetical protein